MRQNKHYGVVAGFLYTALKVSTQHTPYAAITVSHTHILLGPLSGSL